MKTYSLYELNQYIRRVMALNLPDAIWVSCEVAQLQQSRGHFYLSLVQKAEDGINFTAKADAILWHYTYLRLRRKTGNTLDQILQEGFQLMLQLRVSYDETYGLQMIIEDIDPSYTLGQLEMERRSNLDKLKKEGLMELNRQLAMPPVLQRIAVLSASTAAGLQDFRAQLAENPYGYTFSLKLFATSVQGKLMESEMLEQLKLIKAQSEKFDCLAIIRGGGSKLDLLAFDSLELNRAIAKLPIPVLTGVGHDINQTIMDQLACRALKTPTALADFLINQNLNFETRLMQLADELRNGIAMATQMESQKLDQWQQQIKWKSQEQQKVQQRLLEYIENEMSLLSAKQLKYAFERLGQKEQMIDLLSPEATMRRGYSLTYYKGKPISATSKIAVGQELETVYSKGAIISTIKKINSDGETK